MNNIFWTDICTVHFSIQLIPWKLGRGEEVLLYVKAEMPWPYKKNQNVYVPVLHIWFESAYRKTHYFRGSFQTHICGNYCCNRQNFLISDGHRNVIQFSKIFLFYICKSNPFLTTITSKEYIWNISPPLTHLSYIRETP